MDQLTLALAQLNKLIADYPELAQEFLASHPELTEPVFAGVRHLELVRLVQTEDNPESFAAYCELLDGSPPPQHTLKQIRKVYVDHTTGTGTVIHGFRGSRKTTYFGVKFMSYRIGKEPHKTNIATGAVDDSPEKVMKSVAALIEFHPVWKECFPKVVPDPQRGWSMEGYFVKDTRLEYDAWVKQQASTIDPTFLGGGYESRRLNGKHPSGVLYIDDIHDINNNSDKQRKDVVKALTSVILKTVIRANDKLSTWVLGVGVPWASDDGYQTMINSGYGYTATPAMRMAAADTPRAVYLDGLNPAVNVVYEDLIGWWVLEYPEVFGVNSVIQERSFGKADFWQMIMLDLGMASTGRLKYYDYPESEIDWTLPVFGGCDPTNDDDTLTETSQRSYFALAYVAKLPGHGAVVVDGVLEQCSQLAAENYIVSAQAKFPNWQFTAVENVAGGKGFIQTLRRNAAIRVVPSGLKNLTDARIHSKKDRLSKESSKFEDMSIRISSANTPFLNALRRAFNQFFDLSEHDYAFDAWDAVFHAMRQMPDAFTKGAVTSVTHVEQTKSHVHPLAHINTYTGYGHGR